MQTAGIADEGGVGLLGEGLVEGVEAADAVDLFDVALAVRAHGGRDDVCEAAGAVGEDLDRVAQQGAEIARVALADAAESDDENLHAESISLFGVDRKSTRLNSSHLGISYAV